MRKRRTYVRPNGTFKQGGRYGWSGSDSRAWRRKYGAGGFYWESVARAEILKFWLGKFVYAWGRDLVVAKR
jgi:hypothetical protein